MMQSLSEHDSLDRPLRLVLFGGPGVGKGTQAEILRERLRVKHFSTGEFFRTIVRQGTGSATVRQALDCIHSGCLVPDKITIELVREQVSAMNPDDGMLLDGFPRTVPQAAALDEILSDLGQKLDAVLYLELPQTLLIERLSGRRVCVDCGASYHKINRPSKVRGVCDACGGKLVQRNDDQPEAIHVRLDTYDQSTRPVADFYRMTGRLIPISADGTPEEVAQRTLKLLAEHLRVHTPNAQACTPPAMQ